MTDHEALMMCIKNIIDEADRMAHCYWFVPQPVAAQRRIYDKRHSHELVEWTEGGHSYTAEFNVTSTCHNVYARGIYTRDGNKTTLKAIRNSYLRMIGGKNNG